MFVRNKQKKAFSLPYCILHLEDGAHKLLHTTDDWQIKSQRRQKESMRGCDDWFVLESGCIET